ncbi:hypothetical protein BDA96_06G257200 [Sorghum bicolor]|uniref:Uncharacterized protein n=2 Tax=Sorghum bicolor TaxID=4558 RepID=A0A921QU55_SORBI|nr:hypothetical protein BDA96_06G257200 [Sorghum bicolor]KXG27232.1 hypothetical protein SORBI_3006G234900 [Sorghum bicolor]
MASFAAQLKVKFLGVVDRITGWANDGASVDKDTPPEEEESAKLRTVQQPAVEVRSRGSDEPIVGKGDEAGAN